tara:strand:+ start:328 stop:816 length:489 start_codon:yes stop_codon:yes gene_type:complete
MMSGTDRAAVDFRNLLDALREHSVIKDLLRWKEMLQEWKHFRHFENNETCLCGKKHIVHCHEVVHRETGKVMGSIGSSCIVNFDAEVRIDAEIAEEDAKAKIKHEKDGQKIVPANFKRPDVRGKTRAQVWEESSDYIVYMLDHGYVKNVSARNWFTTKLNMA